MPAVFTLWPFPPPHRLSGVKAAAAGQPHEAVSAGPASAFRGNVEAVGAEPWAIAGIRLTLFHNTRGTGPGIWEGLTGEPPEQQSLNPRTYTCQESGSFLGGTLAVAQSPSRYDVTLAPLEPSDAEVRYEYLGNFAQTATGFLEICVPWLTHQPSPIHRVAFGVTAEIPVADREAGYQRLATYLPAVTLSDGASDFLFQINRRRPSNSIPGLTLNRLSHWSVRQFVQHLFAMDGAVLHGPTFPFVQSLACRSQLDVNTAPERTAPFSADELINVIQELHSLASEILEVGDVP